MLKENSEQLPKNGRINKIYNLTAYFLAFYNMNSIPNLLVLAGGYGTRLSSELSGSPKPLAPIGNSCFLAYLLEAWKNSGVRRYAFLLHYQADQIINFLREHEENLLLDCEWSTIIEPTPLGTGGAIANAIKELNLQGNLLIANADTWVGNSLKVMATSHPPSIGVIQVNDTQRYGAIKFNKNQIIKEFTEKQDVKENGWINAGIYHLEAASFLQWNGLPFSLEQDFLPNLIKHKEVKAVPLETEFIDIGIPKDYKRFNQWIESGRSFQL